MAEGALLAALRTSASLASLGKRAKMSVIPVGADMSASCARILLQWETHLGGACCERTFPRTLLTQPLPAQQPHEGAAQWRQQLLSPGLQGSTALGAVRPGLALQHGLAHRALSVQCTQTF